MWKDVLRHWISDEYIHETIILSSASDSDRTSEIPDTAPYIKRCLQEFSIALAITQTLDVLDHTISKQNPSGTTTASTSHSGGTLLQKSWYLAADLRGLPHIRPTRPPHLPTS